MIESAVEQVQNLYSIVGRKLRRTEDSVYVFLDYHKLREDWTIIAYLFRTQTVQLVPLYETELLEVG